MGGRTGPTGTPRPSGSSTGTGTPTPRPSATPDLAYPIVVGGRDPASLPARELFIPLSTWQSAVYGESQQVSSYTGDHDGSSAVVPCDTDTSNDGRFGIGIYTEPDPGGSVGVERIRSFVPSETEADQLVRFYLDDLRRALDAGCTLPDVTVTTTPGPTKDTWKVVERAASGTDRVSVVALATVGYGLAATVVITDTAGRSDAELFRAVAALQRAATGRG